MTTIDERPERRPAIAIAAELARAGNGEAGGLIRDLYDENNRLQAENGRMRQLLMRWLADCTSTHNIYGQPICLVQDTYIALGREPLKPLRRE